MLISEARMSEEHNSEVFLRPRFKMDIAASEEEVLNKFKGNLSNKDCTYCSKIVDNHIFIDVPPEDDHYWSPHLHIEIVKESEKLTWVKGLFSPKPQVWTLFIFLHFIVGFVFLIFLIMLYVRWTLDGDLLFPVIMTCLTPVIWAILYFIGRWGRRQGKDQMEELHEFLIKTLNSN